MAIVPIRICGDPVLHSPSTEITAFDRNLIDLARDLRDTMVAAPGVGLAAPQIGVAQRVFVYSWTDDDGTLHEGTAVNPTLWLRPAPTVPLDEDAESEGCLSFPGERYPLRRAPAVLLEAQDEHGEPYRLAAEGWLARILQHEYDHLDGVLYLDRLASPHDRAAAKQMRRRGWGSPGNSWLPGRDDLEG